MVIEVKKSIMESIKKHYEDRRETEPGTKEVNNTKNETGITPELVALEIYTVYLRCMQEIPVMTKDKETGKQVPTGVYQFDSRTALKALQLLGDAVGLFKNKSSEQSESQSYEDFLKSEGFEYEF